MQVGDAFFGLLALLLLVMVGRSLAGRISSGNVAPKDLDDWREYALNAAYVLVVLSWVTGPLLGLNVAGTVVISLLVVAVLAYIVLYVKTRRGRGDQ